MKRSNTVLRIPAAAAPKATILPWEIWQQILGDVSPLDVATLLFVSRLSRGSLEWLQDKLSMLWQVVLSTAATVCSRSAKGRRYDNLALMMDKLAADFRHTDDYGLQYARGLAVFFQRHSKICLSVMELDEENPQHQRLLLRVLNYASLFAQHLVLPLPQQRRTKEKLEEVRLISDLRPGCATRLCDVVCRRGTEVLPLSSFRIKSIQNAAPTEEARKKEMLACVATEKDLNQKELMRYYAEKKGTAQERRAQYYTVTRQSRELARPDLTQDCFQDLVIKQQGQYVHIYANAAADFLKNCFVYSGKRKDRDRVFHLLCHEKEHVAKLHKALNKVIKKQEEDDCCIIGVREPSVD